MREWIKWLRVNHPFGDFGTEITYFCVSSGKEFFRSSVSPVSF